MGDDLILNLDDFGRRALDQFATRGGGSRAVAVRTASLYYLADRETERPAWHVPSFRGGARHSAGLRVRLDDETRQALAAEAARQGVDAATLAAHAVLYFLADLDSGRLGGRLEGALHDGS